MADTSGPRVAYLRAVRVVAGDGGSSVEFDFESHLPGWVVEPVGTTVQASGTGAPLDVAGTTGLRVRLEPASTVDLSGPRLRRTYDGPTRVAGGGAVTEVRRSGDFEGVLEWVIGVAGDADHHVRAVAHPPRLVVDVGR